jgi:hypothetical protein
MMDRIPPDQGRAPHLYDEQLQRQQQEKALIRGSALWGPPIGDLARPAFFSRPQAEH